LTVCRFLVVKSAEPFDAGPWLERFADMAETSRAPDGDRQADGWGVSWISAGGGWRGLKSVAPVWEERAAFASVPSCRVLAVHARSASFASHKGVLDYSQPFVDSRHAFVFNGLLRGVSLPAGDGRIIGSQRIWDLFRALKERTAAAGPDRESARESLERLVGILESRSREVSALNIALCDASRIYVYCRFADHPSYYQLHALESPGLAAVCSRPLSGLNFRPIPTGRVLAFGGVPSQLAINKWDMPASGAF
jgi:predicted glutamine amidotransferase